MKLKLPIIIFIIILLGTAAFTDTFSIGQTPAFKQQYHERASDSSLVELNKISSNLWMHTTYANYEGFRTPSNGIVCVTHEGIILVDTPWNNEQTEVLMTMLSDIFQKEIEVAVITHAHEDRIGGISALLDSGVDVRSTEKTAFEAEKLGFKKPKPLLDLEPVVSLGGQMAEIYYPGEGHTADNITVFFPEDKVLFGGCLIKSMDAKGKGNTRDGNLLEWPKSVLKVMDRYADAVVVIPGHGKWGNSDLLGKTWELVSEK